MLSASPAIPTWSADEVRSFINARTPEAYALLDVRQPAEFDEGHLPGAQLLPLDQLPDRLEELGKGRQVVVYCRRGARGAAAAAVLLGAGFTQVRNLEGGIEAWNGETVPGLPDAGDSWFVGQGDLAALIGRAWSFEEGAKLFYQAAAAMLDGPAVPMFEDLARAEVQHADALARLGLKLCGEGFTLPEGRPEQMEGGADLNSALSWLEGKDGRSIMEYALALETIAYDRYVQLLRRAEDPAAAKVFRMLADGERLHLKQILDVFEGCF
jgi:rhodanese-related sulfurtransferase/rubrerythrin